MLFQFCYRKFFFFFFLGDTPGLWEFLGQGSNLCHCTDLSRCSGDTGSLSLCATGELPQKDFLKSLQEG